MVKTTPIGIGDYKNLVAKAVAVFEVFLTQTDRKLLIYSENMKLKNKIYYLFSDRPNIINIKCCQKKKNLNICCVKTLIYLKEMLYKSWEVHNDIYSKLNQDQMNWYLK